MNKSILVTVFAIGLNALSVMGAQSILEIKNSITDDNIIAPESFETQTRLLEENFYLKNYVVPGIDLGASQTATPAEYEERLKKLPTEIELPYNSVVGNYINMYLTKRRSLVADMLALHSYYGPIFVEELLKEGMPTELQYLPVIESAINPNAVSRAGAAGLWQFMPATAKGLGMEVNSLIDERRDARLSSRNAARYLKQLYEIYNDWSLAIAAYNCGPGNVNKALRRCEGDGKKDFWTIYPYLPAETRGYVPCFIAANYVMTYYNKHNISPALAKRPILTDSVHVCRRIHFKQIADVLHIPVEELQILNPQYRKQEIPGDIRPYPLVLPANQIYAYIMSENAIAAQDADLYARRDVVEPATGLEPRPATVNGQEGEWVMAEQVKYHKVRRNETMASIAKKYGVTLRSLKRANGNISKPKRGQTLKVITTEKVFKPYEQKPEEGDNLLVRNPEVEGNETAPTDSVNDISSSPDAETAQLTPETDDNAGDYIADNSAAPAESAVAADNTSDSASSAKVENSFRASKAKQTEQKKQPAKSKKKSYKKQSAKTHTVRSGDSLYKIAKANGTTVKEIRRLNNLKGDKINPGDKLRVK